MLSDLAAAFETVRRLTQLYNRVRFGDAELDGGQRRRLGTVISRLEGELGALAAAGGIGGRATSRPVGASAPAAVASGVISGAIS